MIPSVKTLMQITGNDRPLALKVRRVLDGRLSPAKASPKAASWADRCHFRPHQNGHELILAACDELLGGCGVESVNPECDPQNYDEGIRMCPAFSYVNFGDTYIATLVRDHEASRWRVMSWGDALEWHEKRCTACRKRSREEYEANR